MAFLTVMGLYNFDNTLLNNLVYPGGMDGDKLKNAILLETAELEVVYPDPRFFKTAINLWSNIRLDTWNRIYHAAQLEYNPIENYNRYETETSGNTRQHSGVDSTSESVQGSSVTDGENTRTISNTNTIQNSNQGSGSDSQTTTNEITAFDSNALVTHDRSATTGQNSSSLTQSGTETQSGTDTVTDDTTVTNTESKTGSFTHGEKIADTAARESHIHGNIGVTTSQQMLQSELEISEKLNVYDYIVQEFKRRFCILVY